MYRFDLVKLVQHTLECGCDLEATICGHSMEPVAYHGDTVLIKPIDNLENVQEGMIVAMLSADNRHFVLHRVQKVDHEKDIVYEKGDNCSDGKYVSMHTIKGIVTRINGADVN